MSEIVAMASAPDGGGYWLAAADGEQVLATVAAAWQWIQGAFNAGVAFVQGLIEGATALWQQIWANHGETITAVVQNLWSTIQSVFNIGKAIVEGIINLFLDAIHGEWYKFGQDLRKMVDTIWANVQTIFGNAVKNIILIVSDLVQSIIAKFQEIDWNSVGKGVIEGIANGIKNAAGFLADAARDAARAALDAAKGFLGIHSPSSVAAEMIGVPFVEGIGAGIDRAMGQLAQTQLANLSARMAAVPVAGGAAHGGSSSASIDYDRLGGAVATAMRAHPTYQISANYRYQDERELRDDLRLLQMLGAAT